MKSTGGNMKTKEIKNFKMNDATYKKEEKLLTFFMRQEIEVLNYQELKLELESLQNARRMF